jgi:hypothetical protein
VHFLLIISNVMPLWNCLISSSVLRSPSHGHILQASMFASLEKPFLLPKYAEAMACTLATSGPTSLPSPRVVILGVRRLTGGRADVLAHYARYKPGVLNIISEYSIKIPQIYSNMLKYTRIYSIFPCWVGTEVYRVR